MKKQMLVLISFIFLFLSASFFSVLSQNMPMYCREFRVGGGSRPDVASLPNGNFVICWEGEWHHVFAQVFDKKGEEASSVFQVSTTCSERYPEPRIASLRNGIFVVCWGVYKEKPNKNSDIYAQIFSEDGSKIGEEFIACSNPEIHQGQNWCEVTGLNNDDFIIAWESHEEDGWNGGIFGQRFSQEGEPIGEQFQLNSFPENADERLVSVSSIGESGFAAVWHREWFDFGPDVKYEEIGFQCFDENNQYVWNEKTIKNKPIETSAGPVIAALRDSTFIVCWSCWANFFQEAVWAQKFDKNGDPMAEPFQVNTSFGQMTLETCIATLNSGDFVICWRHHTQVMKDGEELTYLEIRGQIFNEAAEKVGSEFKVNSISGENLRHNLPSVTAHGDSGFVVTWMEKWSTIFGKVFSTDSINVIEEEDEPLPSNFVLHRNYPNPFREVTQIPYSLPERERWYYVKIRIYNSMGALVKTLFREYQNGGHYSVDWDGTDRNGLRVAKGMYFCHVYVNGRTKTAKLIFMR